jgi:hypothetical protein
MTPTTAAVMAEGEQTAKRPGQHGRQPAGMPEGRHEADELEHHYQGAGRGLGHAQTIEHLAWLEPAIVLDRLLRHIGQHRIGAPEGDDGHLAEEDGDLAEHAVVAQGGENGDHRRQPQREPQGGHR